MGCPHEREIAPLLQGTLNADATRRTMEHLRGCDDCKSRFEFHTQAVFGKRAAAPVETAAPPREFEGRPMVPESPIRYTRYRPEDLEMQRGGRRAFQVRGLMAMGMIVAVLVYMFQARAAADGPRREAIPEVATALAAGLAMPWHPEGSLETRPRVLSFWLPAGTEGATLRFSSAGASVLDLPVQMEAPGVIALEKLLEGKDGNVKSLRVTMPFPSEQALPLVQGQTYEWRILLEGQSPSLPLSFVLAP